MKKIITILLFILCSFELFSQSWHAEDKGSRYFLEKNSTGVYTLTTKFDSGKIAISRLKRYDVKYDNKYFLFSTRVSASDEYCSETIINGIGEPWPNVILSWYKTPNCIGGVCSVMNLIIEDGNDLKKIMFYED